MSKMRAEPLIAVWGCTVQTCSSLHIELFAGPEGAWRIASMVLEVQVPEVPGRMENLQLQIVQLVLQLARTHQQQPLP